jgi:3'-phosphoadenosine 5'-phosphosulfate sulfotransferase (PAPS reductase)/FAD synthetase
MTLQLNLDIHGELSDNDALLRVKRMVMDGALVVSNHSGGKDSQAMLIKLREFVPPRQLLVVHASLGEIEWHGALDLARQQAQDAGLEFIVARAAKSFFDMVLKRFADRPSVPSWPSASSRQCTSDLKRGPISREVRRYADANGFEVVINCLGLRAQESPGRAAKKVLVKNDTQTNSKRTWFEFLPVHSMLTDEVFKAIADAGQKPHYAYSLGNDRLSCVFCIMASKNDMNVGACHRPELLDKYDDIERQTGYTMHMSRVPIRDLAARSTA